MKKALFVMTLISFIAILSFAQKQGKGKIDSLLSVLNTAKADTSKVNTLNELAYEFRNDNPDTSIYYSNEAKALAIKLMYKFGIANAYLNIGYENTNQGNYETALKNTNDGLTIYDRLLQIPIWAGKRSLKLKS